MAHVFPPESGAELLSAEKRVTEAALAGEGSRFWLAPNTVRTDVPHPSTGFDDLDFLQETLEWTGVLQMKEGEI